MIKCLYHFFKIAQNMEFAIIADHSITKNKQSLPTNTKEFADSEAFTKSIDPSSKFISSKNGKSLAHSIRHLIY